jgi:hypothetical protein
MAALCPSPEAARQDGYRERIMIGKVAAMSWDSDGYNVNVRIDYPAWAGTPGSEERRAVVDTSHALLRDGQLVELTLAPRTTTNANSREL